MKNKKFALISVACIALYALGGFLITPIENITNAKTSLTVFSLIVSFATAMLVFANEQSERRKCLFGANRDVIIKTDKKYALVFSIIVFVSSLIFFYIGFKYRMWYVAWIMFLVAGIIIEILKRRVFKI